MKKKYPESVNLQRGNEMRQALAKTGKGTERSATLDKMLKSRITLPKLGDRK